MEKGSLLQPLRGVKVAAVRAGKEPSRSLKFYNHGEGPYYRALNAATATFTFKNLLRLRHYAKQALTNGK